jgi:hypothetical protein
MVLWVEDIADGLDYDYFINARVGRPDLFTQNGYEKHTKPDTLHGQLSFL